MATTSRIQDYPQTHQGVRDLDRQRPAASRNPIPVNVGPNERALSAVAGAALAATGLASRGWLGVGLLFAGASLLARGVTGFCAVNQALGRNTAR